MNFMPSPSSIPSKPNLTDCDAFLGDACLRWTSHSKLGHVPVAWSAKAKSQSQASGCFEIAILSSSARRLKTNSSQVLPARCTLRVIRRQDGAMRVPPVKETPRFGQNGELAGAPSIPATTSTKKAPVIPGAWFRQNLSEHVPQHSRAIDSAQAGAPIRAIASLLQPLLLRTSGVDVSSGFETEVPASTRAATSLGTPSSTLGVPSRMIA
jgi:hypothetical protein